MFVRNLFEFEPTADASEGAAGGEGAAEEAQPTPQDDTNRGALSVDEMASMLAQAAGKEAPAAREEAPSQFAEHGNIEAAAEEGAEEAATDVSTEGDEETPAEGTEETPEGEEETPAAEAGAEEPAADEDDPFAEFKHANGLYKGKYKTAVEMVKAADESQSEIGRLRQEIGQLREKVEKPEQTAPAEQLQQQIAVGLFGQWQEAGEDEDGEPTYELLQAGDPIATLDAVREQNPELTEWALNLWKQADPINARMYERQMKIEEQYAERQSTEQQQAEAVRQETDKNHFRQAMAELAEEYDDFLSVVQDPSFKEESGKVTAAMKALLQENSYEAKREYLENLYFRVSRQLDPARKKLVDEAAAKARQEAAAGKKKAVAPQGRQTPPPKQPSGDGEKTAAQKYHEEMVALSNKTKGGILQPIGT